MAKKRTKRPAKMDNVMAEVRRQVEAGTYRDTSHATQRRDERRITRLEMLQVLKNGRHEKRKDEFKHEHGDWNYAIRGKTVDSRELRIGVAFVEPGLLIITAIDLAM